MSLFPNEQTSSDVSYERYGNKYINVLLLPPFCLPSTHHQFGGGKIWNFFPVHYMLLYMLALNTFIVLFFA